jgi:hypothetical protein
LRRPWGQTSVRADLLEEFGGGLDLAAQVWRELQSLSPSLKLFGFKDSTGD